MMKGYSPFTGEYDADSRQKSFQLDMKFEGVEISISVDVAEKAHSN